MLIEKEIIAPGKYWYVDQQTRLPRSLDATTDMTRYWYEQGSKMLSSGLTVPVPYEHDFDAHPMTPKEKLLNNAGWVREYKLKDIDDPKRGKLKDVLFGVVEIEDESIAKKLPKTIRWTSPWINSFTDGKGTKWNNVISHLALTTRPRIVDQQPFPNIAAALSMATVVKTSKDDLATTPITGDKGFYLSGAARLVTHKKTKQARPLFPIAFSMLCSGVPLADDGGMPPLKKKPPKGGGDDSAPSEDEYEGGTGEEDGGGGDSFIPDEDPSNDSTIDAPPYGSPQGDVTMEELLCDLLGALGINCEKTGNEQQFKRSLYTAAMMKINELTNKAQSDKPQPGNISNSMKQQQQQQGNQNNPILQQEQQPMYMSLEEINKIPDPMMKNVALSMYNENVKLRAEMEAAKKTTDSLRDAKLKEANVLRANRIALLAKVSPRVKADLEAMAADASMALSMGEGGAVIDPMASTLAMLEKGLADVPRLLTTDTSALSVVAHPKDETMLDDAKANEYADSFARMMGAPPEKKAS